MKNANGRQHFLLKEFRELLVGEKQSWTQKVITFTVAKLNEKQVSCAGNSRYRRNEWWLVRLQVVLKLFAGVLVSCKGLF